MKDKVAKSFFLEYLRFYFWILTISAVVFLVAYLSVRSDSSSDPKFIFVVSQILLQEDSIQMDSYQGDLLLDKPFQEWEKTPAIYKQNGHYYYYFPLGPSILTLPIVAVANAFDLDMRLAKANYNLQRLFSAISCVLVLWIVYKLALTYFDEHTSLIMAAIFVLGSSMISTLGTALWTLNFSTIFMGAGVVLLARYDHKQSNNVHPIWLGLLLFLSYFVRASSATFIVAVFFYLLLKDRRQLLITASTSFICFLLFAVWSRLSLGQWLPQYYSLTRFQDEFAPFWTAVYGHLFSPSRGFLFLAPIFCFCFQAFYFYGLPLNVTCLFGSAWVGLPCMW